MPTTPEQIVFSDVEYDAQPPELNILDFRRNEPDRVEEFIRRSFRVKTLKWAAEEEVRAVYQVDDLTPPKVKVPPHTIRALYMGHSIAASDRATILGWSTSISIYQAIVGSDGQFTFHLARAAVRSRSGDPLQRTADLSQFIAPG